MKKPNMYGLAKAMLSSAIIVNNWWKPGYDLRELVRGFGKGALQRGIDNAAESDSPCPASVQQELSEF